MRYGLMLILYCLCYYSYGQPANIYDRRFTTKDGLTNNEIYCLAEDSRGFLWIGTKEGLNRFDGAAFKQFFAEKNAGNSLPSNNVFSITEYRYGQLLIATGSGLAVYNSLIGKFENEKIAPGPLSAGSRITMNSLFQDPSGLIWVNHSGEIDILDSNLHLVQHLSREEWAKPLKGILVRFGKWMIDNKSRVWVSSDTSGINIIDLSKKQVLNYKNNPGDLAFLKHKYIRSFLLDETKNIVWYAPWGLGLTRYDIISKKETTQRFGYFQASEESTINAIVVNNEGKLFSAGGSFLYETDPEKMGYRMLARQNGVGIFKTKDGNYWEATYNGLVRMPGTTYATEYIIKTRKGVPGNCAAFISTAKGLVYGLFRNRVLVQIETRTGKLSVFENTSPGPFLFTSVTEDKTGVLWISTTNGVILFDPLDTAFHLPGNLPVEIQEAKISTISCDKAGDIWIATRSPLKIFRFSKTEQKAEELNNPLIEDFTGLYGGSRITEITEDRHHTIWFSSQIGGGILSYNKVNREWKLFPVNKTKNRLLIERGITSLHVDERQQLWLTDFYGNGLMRYNYSTDSLDQFTRNDGLLSDFIQHVYAGPGQNLYIISKPGISVFNTNSLQSSSQALPENLVFSPDSQPKILFDSITRSLMLLCDTQLLVIPDPSRKIINPLKPLIDKIAVNNITRNINPENQVLSLAHDQNHIAFEFTTVQLSEGDNIRLGYQLSGVDADWKIAGKSRSAQYASLSPGQYIFRVRTTNENNTWNKDNISFSFKISPPWWQTWGFRIAASASLLGLIYGLMKFRIRQIEKEADLKHKIAETEMMALRAQMNPHFVFNCLSAIDNMIQTDQKDKATTYLTRFAQLIRVVLDSSKNNLIPFHKDYESINLFLQLEQFRGNNKFDYELNVDQEILNSDFKVPPLIIQPFVENAIHHGLMNKSGAARKLVITITLEKEYLKYSIVDNGAGRQKAGELNRVNRPGHQSYGIEIAKKRLDLHNQNGRHPALLITDLHDNDIPLGTLVELWLLIK